MGAPVKPETREAKARLAARLLEAAARARVSDTEVAGLLNVAPKVVAKWRQGVCVPHASPADLTAAIATLNEKAAAFPEVKAPVPMPKPKVDAPSATVMDALSEAVLRNLPTKALLAELARRLGA